MVGKVFLVGAGPGDPGLITVKGLRCLEEADVIVYDRLIDHRLLHRARPGADLVYVGKEAGQHTVPQSQINAFMVEKAREGKIVTRLKGGDPFVFGRGGEEAEVLVDAGITFEVVPGVTSAVAVPAYAGIPVTHRDHTSSVAIIAGREDPTKETSLIPWEELAKGPGTLIFLMGVKNLPHIVEQLVGYGRSPATPVALIRWGTGPRQETLVGTLGDIVQRVETNQFKPPATIIVGEVVQMREKLRWFDNRPLFGKRVLVTRPREQARAFSRLLEQSGAVAVELPTVQIEPPMDSLPFEDAVRRVGDYNWLIFTSVNGVQAFMAKLVEVGEDVRALKGVRLGAIGSATAGELKKSGLRIDFVPNEFVAEAVAEGLKSLGVAGSRVLLPRAEVAREVLPVRLREAGAVVDEVVAYRTVGARGAGAEAARLLAGGEVDVVTFTSSSTVQNLIALLKEGLEGVGQATAAARVQGAPPPAGVLGMSPGYPKEFFTNTVNACIGPITARTAEELGVRVDVVAKEYTTKGLVNALIDHYSRGGG